MFQGNVLPSLAIHTIVGLGVLCDHGRMRGGTNRQKGVCTTQKQAVTYMSKKKGATMLFKPNGLGRHPYSKRNIS